jgi:hypothetical protein
VGKRYVEGPLVTVEGLPVPVEGLPVPVEGPLTPLEGLLMPFEGPLMPVEGLLMPFEGPLMPVEGPLVPVEGMLLLALQGDQRGRTLWLLQLQCPQQHWVVVLRPQIQYEVLDVPATQVEVLLQRGELQPLQIQGRGQQVSPPKVLL